jgi:hypothetical protein
MCESIEHVPKNQGGEQGKDYRAQEMMCVHGTKVSLKRPLDMYSTVLPYSERH